MTDREPTTRRQPRRQAQAKEGDRFGSYIRVSMVGERDVEHESYGTEKNQRGQQETWARDHGVELVGPGPSEPAYLDRDESGKTMRRPALDRMLADLEAGKVDGVVVTYLDRFSRAKPGDAMEIVQWFVDRKKPLAILDIPGADPTTSTGELILNVMLSMSRFFSKQRGEKFRDSRDRALDERQMYLSHTTPFGYRRVDWKTGEPVGPNARAARLDVHPVEGPVVTELFERRAAGESERSLRRWLQSTGLKPSARRKRIPDPDDPRRKLTVEMPRPDNWAPSHVHRYLKRRIYLGELSDKHSGVTVENAHPPLTDPVTWQAANDRHGSQGQSAHYPQALLYGMVRCAGCRYKMVYRSDTERLVCRRATSHGDCPAPAGCAVASQKADKYLDVGKWKLGSLSEDRAREIISRRAGGATWNALSVEFDLHPQTIKRLCERGQAGYNLSRGLDDYVMDTVIAHLERHEEEIRAFGLGEGLEQLKAEAEQAEAEYEADATDLDLQELLGREMWLKRITERRRVAEEQRGAYDEKARTAARPLLDRPVPQLAAELRNGNMPVEDKQALLRSVVQWIFVASGRKGARGATDDRVRIVWSTDPPVDIPRQGKSGWTPTPFPFDDAD